MIVLFPVSSFCYSLTPLPLPLQFNTQVIADAMTCIHMKNFKKIEPREFLVKSFADRRHAPNLVATADYFNHVMLCSLSNPHPSLCLSIPPFLSLPLSFSSFTIFIPSGELLGSHVGHDGGYDLWNGSHCQVSHSFGVEVPFGNTFSQRPFPLFLTECTFQLRNFDLLLSIISALNLASIQRIRFLWKKVPPKYLQQLEMLEETMSPLYSTHCHDEDEMRSF
jgi:hypothetical protein